MREYEVVHKIFNECARNYSRDTFIEEIEIPEGHFEEYLRNKHKDKEIVLERKDLGDDSVCYKVFTSGIEHEYVFTSF